MKGGLFWCFYVHLFLSEFACANLVNPCMNLYELIYSFSILIYFSFYFSSWKLSVVSIVELFLWKPVVCYCSNRRTVWTSCLKLRSLTSLPCPKKKSLTSLMWLIIVMPILCGIFFLLQLMFLRRQWLTNCQMIWKEWKHRWNAYLLWLMTSTNMLMMLWWEEMGSTITT